MQTWGYKRAPQIAVVHSDTWLYKELAIVSVVIKYGESVLRISTSSYLMA